MKAEDTGGGRGGTAARLNGRAAPCGESQSASAVLMVRPDRFGSNAETLGSNHFQRAGNESAEVYAAARAEFDALTRRLTDAGVEVRIFAGGGAGTASPDEVFPNNWLSTHADGSLVLYPLMAPSRRLERRAEIVEALCAELAVARVVDLTALEARSAFLEGTGSLVLDRPARVAFACLSPRTSPAALEAFERELAYCVQAFAAVDARGRPIYHTNVMLSLGTRFAVVCAEAVPDAAERRRLLEALEASSREIVTIGFAEMASFAANVLELRGRSGPILALSARALAALEPPGRRALEKHAELVPADVGTIETYGGGSVRCMLAEVHLVRRSAAGEARR